MCAKENVLSIVCCDTLFSVILYTSVITFDLVVCNTFLNSTDVLVEIWTLTAIRKKNWYV
jgi:hypothetical protein